MTLKRDSFVVNSLKACCVFANHWLLKKDWERQSIW